MIEDLRDFIDDAFDTWPELKCSLDGLMAYTAEYENYFEGKDNLKRAAHVILFCDAAIRKGYELTEWLKELCSIEMQYLEKNKISILNKEREILKQKIATA